MKTGVAARLRFRLPAFRLPPFRLPIAGRVPRTAAGPERLQTEEAEKTVGGEVTGGCRSPAHARSQQAAMHQLAKDVAAGFSPACPLPRPSRLLIGHDGQHVNGGLRQPGLAQAAENDRPG